MAAIASSKTASSKATSSAPKAAAAAVTASPAPPSQCADTIAAFSLFGRDEDRLRPIDLLVKHRELFGFRCLDTLDALIAATITAGPEQSHLHKPLVDDGQDIVAQLKCVAAMREFCRDELGFALETSALTRAQFVSVAVPRLMQAMEQVRWARDADSRALRLRMNSLQLTQQVAPNGVILPAVFPSGFRLRAVVSWKNVLGKDVTETHVTGPELFRLPDLSSSDLASSGNNISIFSGITSPLSGEGSSSNSRFSLSSVTSSTASTVVDVTTVFRTSCTTSFTARISVDTANGLEFAHGFIRASFLPGESAPRYSFSVPLLRPTNLTKITAPPPTAKEAAKAAAMASSFSSSSSSPSSSNSNLHQAAAQAALASGASTHQKMGQQAQQQRGGRSVDPGIVIGSLSVDIDCIASNFLNLVAYVASTTKRSENNDSSSSSQQQQQQQQRGGDGQHDDEKHSHANDAAKAASTRSTFRPSGIEVDENNSTVGFFLKRLEAGAAERREKRKHHADDHA